MCIAGLALIGLRQSLSRDLLEIAVREAGGQYQFETIPSPIERIHRRISGRPVWVSYCIELDGGHVDDAWLHAHSEELNQLNSLSLTLRNTRVTGAGLARLQGPVSGLSLAGTPLTDADVAHFPSTTGGLNVAHTGISSAALSGLAQRRSLYALTIDATQATPEGVSALAASPRLSDIRVVDADDASVAQIARLQGLRSITLFSSGITDASLQDLKQIQDVQWLTLFDSNLSESHVRELQQALPGCIVSQEDSEEWGYSRTIERE